MIQKPFPLKTETPIRKMAEDAAIICNANDAYACLCPNLYFFS